jgi:hypothetical protein
MTNRIIVKATDANIERFSNMLAAVGAADGRKAMARAVNRTTNTVHGRVIRAVAKQSSIPVKIVRRAIKKRLASHKGSGPLQGEVYGTGSPLSLKYFGAKQFSFGVRAKIRGKSVRLPGMFIFAGTFRSGQAVANGHVFQRTTANSKPIEKQTGPSIPEEMVRDESLRIFELTVQSMLPARVSHELGRILNKA